MNNFYRFQIPISGADLFFDLYWNESEKLTHIEWALDHVKVLSPSKPPYAVAAILRDLKNYFSTGEPLADLHWSLLEHAHFSDFSRRVYEAALLIPHGETRTYSWVAHRIGKPLAARAVGQALKRNAFPFLIPCHRVTSDKSLGGFMGTDDPEDRELKLKTWLLDIERSYRNPPFSFVKPFLVGSGF